MPPLTVPMLNLQLTFVAVVWGMNFALVKFALDDLSPLSFTLLRFSLGGIFLLFVAALGRSGLRIAREDRMAVIRLGLIGVTLYNIFFMYGLKLTEASHSALFISMSPLFAALLQAFSGRERLAPRTLAGLLLAFFGSLLIIMSKSGLPKFTAEGMGGDLLTIVAAVLWALYTMNARPLLTRYAPVTVTAYSMLAGSVLLIPFSLGELRVQSWTMVRPSAWAVLLFAAFISGGLAHSLWYRGVQRIGATRTIAYHYVVPFVAVVFAALLLRETIVLQQVIGGIAVLAGVALVQTRSAR